MALRAWIALFSLLAPAAAAQQLEDLQVAVAGHDVLVSFHLEDAFGAQLVERIETGLPTAITYDFVLLRDRKHWWDARLTSNSLEVVAMYNAVTEEYLVNTKVNGKLVESHLARSLPELERRMTRMERVRLFSAAGLPPQTRLLIKARAELGSRTLMGIVPTRVTTPWVESRKFVVPKPI